MSAWAQVEIDAYRTLFRDNPKFRAIATTARRAGLPYTHVRNNWTNDDLHADEALAQVELEEQLERCPDCHAHPDEYLDDRGREMRSGGARWTIKRTDCRLCQLLAKERENLSEDERKAGARIVLLPARGGEPLIQTTIR